MTIKKVIKYWWVLLILGLLIIIKNLPPEEPMTKEEYNSHYMDSNIYYGCQNELKDRLNDPSSYESLDSYDYIDNSAECNFDKKECSTLIHFTAKNGFGGRIKQVFLCEVQTDNFKNPTYLLDAQIL